MSPQLDPRVPHGAALHFACNFGSMFPGRNSVLTVHDLMQRERRRPQDRATAFLLSQCLQRVGRVVAVSDQTRSHVESAFPHLAGKVAVIPHGLRDLPRGTSERGHVLAFGGASDPRKRVALTIEAYRRYRSIASDPLPLVVLSRAGLLEEQQRQLLELGARMVPTATGPDVDTLMADAAALIYPTAEEGFGLPILEAAEAGTPVVMDAGARVPSEVVGPHCVQIAGDSPSAWADGLRRAIAGGPVFGSLSLPSWESVASRYLDVYREVQS